MSCRPATNGLTRHYDSSSGALHLVPGGAARSGQACLTGSRALNGGVCQTLVASPGAAFHHWHSGTAAVVSRYTNGVVLPENVKIAVELSRSVIQPAM